MLYVYFLQAGEDGPIKIGLAEDPEARRDLLQVGNAAELILRAIVPGNAALERQTHERFAQGRLRGEWFAPDTPGLSAAIARAVQIEADIAMADYGLCAQCGRPITRPRTKLCGASCEREHKRVRSSRWRQERASRVPSEE